MKPIEKKEEVVVGGVPPEGGAARAVAPERGVFERMTVERKAEIVMRLLRGENLEFVSREAGRSTEEISGWREEFILGGTERLRSRPGDYEDRELKRAREKIGDLTMRLEIVETVLAKKGGQLPRRLAP